MNNQRSNNAIVFGALFIIFAPLFGGLIWSIFILMDLHTQAVAKGGEFHFKYEQLTLLTTTLALAYKNTIIPALFAGFIGGWWRKSYNKIWTCLTFGLFAALVITVYKYFELVVINTPYMQATTWEYIKIILQAFTLPTFIISSILAYFFRIR